MLNDLWWGIRLSVGFIQTDSGTIHADLSLEESMQYIENVSMTISTIEELPALRELRLRLSLVTMSVSPC